MPPAAATPARIASAGITPAKVAPARRALRLAVAGLAVAGLAVTGLRCSGLAVDAALHWLVINVARVAAVAEEPAKKAAPTAARVLALNRLGERNSRLRSGIARGRGSGLPYYLASTKSSSPPVAPPTGLRR